MRKYVIGAVLVGVIIVIVLVGLANTRTPQQKIYQSSYTATNIQFPYLLNNHTVDYFTGSAFASYDTTNHTTTALSQQLTLPPISDMRWSSTGVLFKAGGSTSSDDLYPAATSYELDSSQEYWWLYSFATQQISYLRGSHQDQQATDAQWIDGDPAHYDYVVGKSVVRSDDRTLFTDSGGVVRLEYASPTKVIYQTAGSSTTIKEHDLTSGTASTLVAGAIKNVGVATSGNYVVYVDHYQAGTTGDTPGDLELLDLRSHATHRVMSNYEGTTSLNNDTTLLISSQTGSTPSQLLRYDVATGKLAALNNDSLDQSHSAASLWVVDPNNYLVDSVSNLLTVFRDQPAVQPIYPNYDYLIQSDLYQNGFELHYRTNNGLEVYNIYITQNPFLQYQQAALQFIRSQKIDPNLINIKWYGNDGVSRPTYVDTAVPTGYMYK